MREITFCSDMTEVYVEGNVIVYSEVCMRYSLREIVLCTVISFQYTG